MAICEIGCWLVAYAHSEVVIGETYESASKVTPFQAHVSNAALVSCHRYFVVQIGF